MSFGRADGTCGSPRGASCYVTLAAAANSSCKVLCHGAAIHATDPCWLALAQPGTVLGSQEDTWQVVKPTQKIQQAEESREAGGSLEATPAKTAKFSSCTWKKIAGLAMGSGFFSPNVPRLNWQSHTTETHSLLCTQGCRAQAALLLRAGSAWCCLGKGYFCTAVGG